MLEILILDVDGNIGIAGNNRNFAELYLDMGFPLKIFFFFFYFPPGCCLLLTRFTNMEGGISAILVSESYQSQTIYAICIAEKPAVHLAYPRCY